MAINRIKCSSPHKITKCPHLAKCIRLCVVRSEPPGWLRSRGSFVTGPSSYPCYQTSSWHQLKKEKRKNSHGNHMISEFYFLLFKNTKIMSSSIQLQFHTTLPHSFKKLKKKKGVPSGNYFCLSSQ